MQQLRFCFSFWISKICLRIHAKTYIWKNCLHSLKWRNIQVTPVRVRVTLYFALKVRRVACVEGALCLTFLRRISGFKLVKKVKFYNDLRNFQGSTLSLDFNFYSVVYLSAFNMHRVPNEDLLYQNSYGIRSSNFKSTICPENSSTFITVQKR
jgi:hypothetical protein